MTETIQTDNKTLKVRPLCAADWDAINELCNRRFGDGYLDYEDFIFRTTFPELNLVADDGEKAVAMVSMTPMELHALAEVEQMDEKKLTADAAGKQTIRFRTAICDERYEGNGIIRTLLKQVIQNANNQGYGVILSTVWKYGGKIPAGRMHTDLGFEDLGERHLLWYNQKGYTCIICKGPCRCDGELFELIL